MLSSNAPRSSQTARQAPSLERSQAHLLHPRHHLALLRRPPHPSDTHPAQPHRQIRISRFRRGARRESDDPSVLASASHLDSSRVLDHDTERLYLTFSWWFLHRGWNALSDRVADAIARTFSPLSVKAQLSLTDLKALVNDAPLHHHRTRAVLERHQYHTTDQPAWKRSHFLDVLFPTPQRTRQTSSSVQAPSMATPPSTPSPPTTSSEPPGRDEGHHRVPRLWHHPLPLLRPVFETFFDSLCPTFGVQKSGRIDSTHPGGATVRTRVALPRDHRRDAARQACSSCLPLPPSSRGRVRWPFAAYQTSTSRSSPTPKSSVLFRPSCMQPGRPCSCTLRSCSNLNPSIHHDIHTVDRTPSQNHDP